MRKKLNQALDRLYSLSKRVKAAVAAAVVLIAFYFGCVTHVEPNEMGVDYNVFTGELRGDTAAGYYVSPPWRLVSMIDLRPMRVSISSTANSYGSKLVQFDKAHWREFVQTQGFGYWWWNNRLSFNSGYNTEYRGFRDVIRGYAYGNKRYEFIIVLEDLSQPE